MNISDQAEGATRPHILMHGWLNAAFVLTHTLVSCWHVSSRFSNNLKHSTAGPAGATLHDLDLVTFCTEMGSGTMNMVVELATCIQDPMSQDETRSTKSTDKLPQGLEGKSLTLSV